MLLNICDDRFHSSTLIKCLLHSSTQTSNCKVQDLPGTKPNCLSDNNIIHVLVNNSISLSLIGLSRLYRSYILGGNFEKGLPLVKYLDLYTYSSFCVLLQWKKCVFHTVSVSGNCFHSSCQIPRNNHEQIDEGVRCISFSIHHRGRKPIVNKECFNLKHSCTTAKRNFSLVWFFRCEANAQNIKIYLLFTKSNIFA